MQRASDGQHQFELVNGQLEVSLKSVATDLEQHLGIEEERHEQFAVVVVLEEVLSALAVVVEANGGGDDRVHQNADHDEHLKRGRLHELAQDQWRSKAAVALIVVDLDQTPTARVAAQHLRYDLGCDRLSGAPHLLELHTDLVEGLRDYGNENVLHQPGQEEDQRRVVGDLRGSNRDGSVMESFICIAKW